MIKIALCALLAAVASVHAEDFFYNEAFFKTETVLPKLDFHRLHEIGSLRPVALKCQTLEREVREMLEEEGRDSQSTGAMLKMVAEVVARKQAGNHAQVVADLELCAERANADGVFVAPAKPSPLLISSLDFRGLVEAVGGLKGDKKCLALEDELREQLGNFQLDSTQLLNKVTCVVHRIGSHLAHSDAVYTMLTECLGAELRAYNAEEDC